MRDPEPGIHVKLPTAIDANAMNCAIYRSDRKPDTYLFVEKLDDFSRLPAALCAMLGGLELVMELDLDGNRKLARADVQEVIANLESKGYYLQLPPTDGHPLDRPTA